MVDKTKLIKLIKDECPIELDTKKLKEMSISQLEEFRQDLKNSLTASSYKEKDKDKDEEELNDEEIL